MTATSSTTGSSSRLTLGDLEQAVTLLKAIPIQKDWYLASPDGRVWVGEPMKLFAVLAQYHPLLQPPTIGEIFQAGEESRL